MTHQEEYEYCKTVSGAASKYNKFSFTLGPETNLIERMEDKLIYNVHASASDAITILNKIFLLRSLNELLCDEEPGTDQMIELFERIHETFDKMATLVTECANKTDDMYDAVDDVQTCKTQHEFLARNSEGEIKIIHDLIVFQIDYLFEKYELN